jgi:hypothetical protein
MEVKMKLVRTLFILFALSSAVTLVARKGRSVSRLKLRVGETDKVRGYDKITSQSDSGKVFIRKNSDKNHSITGMKAGMVILTFEEEGEKPLKQPVDVRERRLERFNNVGVSIGFGYPGYYYSSDPFYDPLNGWGPYSYGYRRYGRRYYPHW